MTFSLHASQGGGFSDAPSTYIQPAVAAPMAQGMNGSDGEHMLEVRVPGDIKSACCPQLLYYLHQCLPSHCLVRGE